MDEFFYNSLILRQVHFAKVIKHVNDTLINKYGETITLVSNDPFI